MLKYCKSFHPILYGNANTDRKMQIINCTYSNYIHANPLTSGLLGHKLWIGLGNGCIFVIMLVLSAFIVCIKRKLQRKMKNPKKHRMRRSRSAARRAAAGNETGAQFYEETTFASGTRTELSANYTSMVRDPYGYADLWLEGDVHVHLPADENDSYDEVQVNEKTTMTFKEYNGPYHGTKRQRRSTKDPYYPTVISDTRTSSENSTDANNS